jgi:ATP-dependent Lhr-like helicase
MPTVLDPFLAARGWSLHPHQEALLARAAEPALLLIAPTGAGKTLSGFLPTLQDLTEAPREGLHTLYVSPLKALATDIRRNLLLPIEELSLPVRVEDRTGDTTQAARRRQRHDPPHVLLTTHESLALLLSYEDAPAHLRGPSPRRGGRDPRAGGVQARRPALPLLSRLQASPPSCAAWAFRHRGRPRRRSRISSRATRTPAPFLHADPGEAPDLSCSTAGRPRPGPAARAPRHPAVLEEVKRHRTTLIFHNTPRQAEIFFHHLWLRNDEGCPSRSTTAPLARAAPRTSRPAMLRGELKAIVCTGTLDLGIDWGDVDLVIQMGGPEIRQAPRPAHRPRQPPRGRALQGDPRPAEPLRGLGMRGRHRRAPRRRPRRHPPRPGPLDVLCQHILIRACAGPFEASDLYAEVRTVGGYSGPSRAGPSTPASTFCATGGYAAPRLRPLEAPPQGATGSGASATPAPPALRMNIGTIEDKAAQGPPPLRAPPWARSRNTSPPPSPPATPS